MTDSIPARPSVARGAPGRVAAVHHQTRRGLTLAALFLAAAVIFLFVPHQTDAWLPLHLFLLGSLLMAISTTTQMLAVTWSTSVAPRSAHAAAQRWLLALGVVVLCVGRETDMILLIELGGAAVVIAVVAMIPILLGIRRHALLNRFTPATDGYLMAMAVGVLGTSVAVVVATDRAGSRWLELRHVHLIVNAFGLVGIVIAATLPYFAATQARRKMSPSATPFKIRVATTAMAVATCGAGIGAWFDRTTLTAGALFAYAGAIALIATMLPIYGRRQLEWAGPRLLQLASGIGWWIVSTLTFALAIWSDGDDRPALRALVIGAFGQILISSLAYLGPVLRGGGKDGLVTGFAITRSWPSLVLGNVAAVGALLDQRWVMQVGLGLWFIDSALRGVLLVATRHRSVRQGDGSVARHGRV